MTRSILLLTSCAMTALAHAQFGPYAEFAPQYDAPERNLVLDLDTDGDQDILLVSAVDKLFWLQNDGTGVLSQAEPFILNGQERIYQNICAADLDGDADMDLVTAQALDSVRWFRNNGALDFEPMPAFLGATAYSIFYGECFDVDLDDDQDLIFHGNTGYTYLTKNTDGLGTFGPLVLLTSAVANIYDFDMGDFDGDGDRDLLMTSRFFGSPQAHSMENTDGQGSFSNLNTFNGVSDVISQYCCALIDMDGDSDLDAAVNVSVAPNGDLGYYPNTDGQGTWGTLVVSGLGSGPMGQWSVLDYDNDGDTDLVGAGFHAQWIELVGPGSFMLHTGADLPVYLDRASVGDINGDGDMDVVATSMDGRCVAWTDKEGSSFGPWNILPFEPAELTDMAAGDVDGDGDLDVAVSARGNDLVGWYPNADGLGTFGVFQRISYDADSALAIELADVDIDGALDLVVAKGTGSLSWFANDDGSGTNWTEHEFASGLSGPNLVRAADLDADGDSDIVFCTNTDHLVHFSLNDDFSLTPQLLGDALSAPASLDVADLNGDPWPDVLVSCTGNTGLLWFAAQAGGTGFTPAPGLPSATSNTVHACAADVDNDGDKDLLYCRGGSLSWMANNGSGTFSGAVILSTGLNIKKARATDFDGDGLNDLLCLRTFNNGSVWLPGLGAGAFAAPLTVPSQMYQGLDILTADVDGDQDPDILQCNSISESAWVENHFGSPYRIGGTVFLDLDNDGTYSVGDELAPYVAVTTAPYVMTPYTEPDGAYLFLLDSGAYTVEAPLVGACWVLNTDSAAYHEILTAQQPAVSGRDFGYAIACDSTSILLSHSLGMACGLWSTMHVHMLNIGTTHPQGSLRVVLDPLVIFVSSVPQPTMQDGDTLWYDQSAFGYFEQRDLQLILDPPGVQSLGQTIQFSMDFETTDGGHFTDQLAQVVACAFDPNAKAVEPVGVGAEGLIPGTTERLTYTLHFQNTGTDTATTVVLHDHLSPLFDRSSLQVLGWSHPFDLHIESDGEALFTFNNIQLPDSGADFLGSQGHVIFSIALQPGLPVGTVVRNSAAIVFDMNPAVLTDTTVNTLFDCSSFVPQVVDLGGGLLQASAAAGYQWFQDGEAIPGATSSQLQVEVTGLYSVQATNDIGCMANTAEQLVVIEGLTTAAPAPMTILPNPSTGNVRLICAEVLHPSDRVELIDVDGRTLRILQGKGSPELIIQRGALPSGIYTLHVVRAGARAGSVRLVME